jgi:hypothetical protein
MHHTVLASSTLAHNLNFQSSKKRLASGRIFDVQQLICDSGIVVLSYVLVTMPTESALQQNIVTTSYFKNSW